MTTEEIYLINGDGLIEENILKRKKRKKVTSVETHKLLEDLVYKGNN